MAHLMKSESISYKTGFQLPLNYLNSPPPPHNSDFPFKKHSSNILIYIPYMIIVAQQPRRQQLSGFEQEASFLGPSRKYQEMGPAG